MAMAACYPNYDLSGSSGMSQHQQQAQLHHLPVSSRLAGGGPMSQKDYSIPLHVDCSVEYELPNQAKPPVGARVEPLLMIHPCYFRKMESQRRSPFINNMPNSTRSSNSIVANVVDSTSMTRRSSKSSSQQAQQQHAVVSSHQSTMHHHQNLQQQIDQYVQRQMAHRPQQASHYSVGSASQQQAPHVQTQQHRHHSHQPQQQQQRSQQMHQQQQQPQQSHLSSQQQQPTNQYNMQTQQQQQQQQQQLVNTSDWSRYMASDGVVRNYGKVNLASQTAYSSSKSKVIKHSNTGMPQLAHTSAAGTGQQQVQSQQHSLMAASCAAAFNNGSLEGGLPSGPRWDIEKTSMAAVPRDFQAGPESLPIKANASLLTSGNSSQTVNSNNTSYQPSASMYRNPSVVGKRDAMLSGGCGVYSSSRNNNNNNTINNNTELGLTAGSLWDPAALLEKSPMAAIPRDYQAGPEHMVACGGKMSAAGNGMLTSAGHSLMRSGSHLSSATSGSSNTSSSGNSNNNNSSSSSGYQSDKSLFAGKYRQHQRTSHRLHPYMMVAGSMGGSFPPLMTPTFPQMQQVSCYNV
ncbi:centrosomal and chromosomal factor-like [Uranotaenia lowii]|uniref:centrosomal and chromosomal factor-like n=1 Tax=Uranotaenia lowii TaxID=190385 RepID=UPI00247987DE|nr:centrosomal and chromosomal factor-like [Uranotaenia lowii]